MFEFVIIVVLFIVGAYFIYIVAGCGVSMFKTEDKEKKKDIQQFLYICLLLWIISIGSD